MGVKIVDRTDFDAIYEENVDKVYQTALYYSKNHHAAEEITQAVFMKLYINLDNISKAAVKVWLLTSTKNMALNYVKAKDREILEDDVEKMFDKQDMHVESIEDDFFHKLCQQNKRELIETIFLDLYRVNERWYDALTITYILEKPKKEVAEIMGISYENLRQILTRAKQWIKKHYEDQYDHLDEE